MLRGEASGFRIIFNRRRITHARIPEARSVPDSRVPVERAGLERRLWTSRIQTTLAPHPSIIPPPARHFFLYLFRPRSNGRRRPRPAGVELLIPEGQTESHSCKPADDGPPLRVRVEEAEERKKERRSKIFGHTRKWTHFAPYFIPNIAYSDL